MKKCACDKWGKYIKDNFYRSSASSAPWTSSGNRLPMYFGVEIDFCPWCGRRLSTIIHNDSIPDGWSERDSDDFECNGYTGN